MDSEFPQTDLHFAEPSQEPTTVVVHSKSNQFDVETSRTNQLLRSLQDVIAVLEAQACRPWDCRGILANR